ncbi:MAG TPA: zinc ribbon domain-containing protein [Nitrososphaerales archaeon]|nr:zinc ribbon domain-containing protein [Nitrososphaerales archaeon]
MKCGTSLPDEALFCMKCGANLRQSAEGPILGSVKKQKSFAPPGTTVLKCPSCGAPINPQFGEMVITCEYCSTGVVLGGEGWSSVKKHTMLPLGFGDKDSILKRMHDMMIVGLLRRHLQDSSTLEELNLSVVPFWIIPVSARTSVVAGEVATQAGTIATTAVLAGILGAAMSGGKGRGGFAGPAAAGVLLGSTMNKGGQVKAFQANNLYQFPVVAMKALSEYQPREYAFDVDDRAVFEAKEFPKGVRILNGDIGEDDATHQARALVDQLQSDKVHHQYHMVQEIKTELETGEPELLHVPIWFARYDHKGKKIVLIVDAHNGELIDGVGLN